MPTREQMERLVRSHADLPERMDTAIWIRREREHDAWLVEIIPDLDHDERAGEPIWFNPGIDFRFPLRLIAANRMDVEAAVRNDPELAAWVAEGEILYGHEVGHEIQELARGSVHA